MKCEKRNSLRFSIACLAVAVTCFLMACNYQKENKQLKAELFEKNEQVKEWEGLYNALADQHSKHIGSEACNTDNLYR